MTQSKETIFNNLIKRLIERKPIFQSQLVYALNLTPQ